MFVDVNRGILVVAFVAERLNPVQAIVSWRHQLYRISNNKSLLMSHTNKEPMTETKLRASYHFILFI
jgi:hypothetical protein